MRWVVVWMVLLVTALASRAPAADCNGNGIDDAFEVSPLAYDLVPIASGLASPGGIVAADLDLDGDLDLAVAENGLDRVSVMLNDGTGTFSAPTTYATGDGPFAIVAARVGGLLALGSDLDLFVANFADDTITWLHNDGDGTYDGTAATTLSAGDGPADLIVADLTGDDSSEMLVANRNASTLTVRIGDGAGGFGGPASSATAGGPQSMILTDVNGNGTLDLLIASRVAGQLTYRPYEVLPEVVVATVTDPVSVAAGDLDGDGDVDAAVASFTGDQVIILRNDGTFPWAAPIAIPVPRPTSVLLTDLDGDGYRDVAATSATTDVVVVARNHGDGTFEAPIPIAVGDGPIEIAAADLDGDLRRDLVVTNVTGGTVSALRLRAAPAVADCDGDGVPDACQLPGHDCNANTIPDACDIVRPRTFAAPVTTTFTSAQDRVAMGDVDGDGRVDVVRAIGGTTNQLEVSLGAADGTFTPGATFPVPDGPMGTVVTDLDGDGDADIAVNTVAGTTILRLAANGTAANTTSVVVGDGPNGLLAVDLDGDGDRDLVSANETTPSLGVARNAGGTFTADAPLPLAHQAPMLMVAGDVDHDGDADVVGLNLATMTIETHLYRNTGGVLADAGVIADPPAGAVRFGIALADLDHDGDADLVTLDVSLVGGDGQIHVYRSDPGDVFTLTRTLPAPTVLAGVPSAPLVVAFFLRDGRAFVVAHDFDGDGNPDVASVDLDQGGLRVFFGDGAGGFGPGKRLVGSLAQPAILTGDFNSDGAPDLVLATGRRALGVYVGNARIPAPDCTGDGVPDVCAATFSDCNGNGLPDTCELASVDADADGIPDCVERDAACGNCRDDDGNGALDLADASCPSTPFTTLRATASPARGRKPGRVAVAAIVAGALPDLAAAPPMVTLTLGDATVYCDRPAMRKRRSTYRLTAPDGVLRTLVVGVNARKGKSKVRALLSGGAVAPAAGGAFGVSLATDAQALHTDGTLRARGRKLVGP